MKYPDYIKKYRPKGTVIKKIGDTYYAYYATSKRIPGKSYPVQVTSGIAGTIDAGGFHPSDTVRVNPGEILVRECGFTNYLLMFEDYYSDSLRGRAKKEAKTIFRSLIVYLSPNSYLNDEKDVKIYPVSSLAEEFGIGIPNQIKVISNLIEKDLKKIEPLKYICNVRMGDRVYR